MSIVAMALLLLLIGCCGGGGETDGPPAGSSSSSSDSAAVDSSTRGAEEGRPAGDQLAPSLTSPGTMIDQAQDAADEAGRHVREVEEMMEDIR